MRTLAKWSIEDYHRMIETGILSDRRVELIAGEIVEMSPEKPLHRFINNKTVKYLRQLLQGKAEVFEAHPITLSNSEPEPDIAIVSLPDTTYLTRHPYPVDIYWLIEISDTTLNYDLGTKKRLYAEAGIKEYWVINLQAKLLKVFRQAVDNDYSSEQEISEGKILALAFEDVEIEVEKLLENYENSFS
jgi:Uma2 family endonuclease